MGELGLGSTSAPEFCPELNPDVIVISDDQSLHFEAQNLWALEQLACVCGFALDTMTLTDRIRVNHCKSRQLVKALTTAGATVVSEG
jgi:DNA-directed RNA polymerase subunit RPC12/RpoP